MLHMKLEFLKAHTVQQSLSGWFNNWAIIMVVKPNCKSNKSTGVQNPHCQLQLEKYQNIHIHAHKKYFVP